MYWHRDHRGERKMQSSGCERDYTEIEQETIYRLLHFDFRHYQLDYLCTSGR